MRRLATCIVIGLLASWHGAHAQTNPATADPKPAKDKSISGVFSPDRVKSDQEASAKKAQDSGAAPFQRGRNYYFAWSSMTSAEFAALARHAVFLFAIWTQKPEERPVYKVAGWKTAVDGASLTAKMYGPNREDGFYLVPGGAMLKKGQIVLDLADRAGWVMLELPSNVATNDARRFPNPDPEPNAKPDLRALQAFVQRKFPGFPVPSSLP